MHKGRSWNHAHQNRPWEGLRPSFLTVHQRYLKKKQAAGLPDSRQKSIMQCVETVNMSCLYDGKKWEWFRPSRGIRQGTLLAHTCLCSVWNAYVTSLIWQWRKESGNLSDCPDLAHSYHISYLLMTCFSLQKQCRWNKEHHGLPIPFL